MRSFDKRISDLYKSYCKLFSKQVTLINLDNFNRYESTH